VASLAAALAAPQAAAYPTSIVFAPTGEVMPWGQVTNVTSVSMNLGPVRGPGPWWLANQFGLLPGGAYGDTGFAFGGVEAGIDAHNGDLFATRGASLAGQTNAYVKTLVNLKVQVLVEKGWLPSLAVGGIVAPFAPGRSPDVLFLAGTKSLAGWGRLTLGFADFYSADVTVFYGTAPFFEGKGSALVAGYESPPLGPFSFVLDHVGGVGEINSTNAALVLTPFQGAAAASLLVGMYFGNDRRQAETRYVGLFAELVVSWRLADAFGPRPAAPP
jgi:hypothetical protein